MIRQSSIDEVAALAEWDRKQRIKRHNEALIDRAIGRSLFCRDRGEVKTPDLIDELVARIRELEGQS